MIAVRSDDTLFPTIVARSLMDQNTKSLKLSRGMNGVSLAIIGILIEDDNGWPKVGGDKTSSSDQGEVLENAVSNTSDIGLVEA